MTYSYFGTLAAAPPDTRRAAIQWLYDRLEVPVVSTEPAIDQWKRAHHPNASGSPRGPELDARIDDPDAALIYVEAKWSADIGTGKGKIAGIPDDQIQLRRDSLRTDPALAGDTRALVVLGVSEAKPDLSKWHESADTDRKVTIAWLTWDELAECPHHPLGDELRRYLSWKRKTS